MKLPDFFIIGASRSGTNSLRCTLATHPKINPSSRRECHFFDWTYHKGLEHYKRYFPARGLTFDTTPNYLYSSEAPARIKKDTPSSSHRFIVLLRNPAKRAWSNFWHFKKKTWLPPGPGEILRRGRYAEYLARWFNHFPKHRFMIIKAEDFFRASKLTANTIIRELLGLKPLINQSRYYDPKRPDPKTRTPYPAPEPEMAEYLMNYYRPHNQRLYDLLGVDFLWESEPFPNLKKGAIYANFSDTKNTTGHPGTTGRSG